MKKHNTQTRQPSFPRLLYLGALIVRLIVETYSEDMIAPVRLDLRDGYLRRIALAVKDDMRIVLELGFNLSADDIRAILVDVLARRDHDEPLHPVRRHVAILHGLCTCHDEVEVLPFYGTM